MKFNHVALLVPDLKVAVDFYVSFLNCEVLFETYIREESELRKVWASPKLSINLAMLQGNQVKIELIERKDLIINDSVGLLEKYPSPHICFQVESVDKVFQQLTSHGVIFLAEPAIIRNKVRIAFFLGPGGNIHEILEVL